MSEETSPAAGATAWSADAVEAFAAPASGDAVCDWDNAVMHVSGVDPDDSEDDAEIEDADHAFFIELATVFYSEAVPRLQQVFKAIHAFNNGQTEIDGDHGERLLVEEAIRGGAHAIKGTAANLRMVNISEAARIVEQGGEPNRLRAFSDASRDARVALSRAEAAGDVPAATAAKEALAAQGAARAEVLGAICSGSRKEVFDLVKRFRDFTVFVQEVMLPRARPLAPEEDGISLEDLEAITLDSFKAQFVGVPM